MEWIKCISGQMPEDDERYKGKKVINVIATTNKGMRAWMPLPEPYKEKH